ncbi:MAG: DnaD domain protein [Alicyclobacillaceae bacterium]|nr:DnaD domain protein [Alicyclobacillaceae bacterium]
MGEFRGDPAGTSAIARLLASSALAIPAELLRWYRDLGLRDEELVLILHLLYMRQWEDTVFPTYGELSRRMSASEDQIAAMIQRLIGLDLMALDHRLDEHTGTWQDGYDLSPLFRKLARLWLERNVEELPRPWVTADAAGRLLRKFEEEFGRPLTSIEIEQLIHWLDEDAYPEWMIQEALREAVLSGTLSLRYMDRVLLEWQRKNIRSLKELQAHRQQFQQRKKSGSEAKGIGRGSNAGDEKEHSPKKSKYDAFYRLYRKERPE